VELDRLVQSLPEVRKNLVQKEFQGFKNLFSRFLAERK
jgi:hypothetical protein